MEAEYVDAFQIQFTLTKGFRRDVKTSRLVADAKIQWTVQFQRKKLSLLDQKS